MATLPSTPLVLASLLLAAPAITRDTAEKRPNIVFIFTDDHAAHAISAYGSKINKTPHIDRIAREGMRFDNCLVTNAAAMSPSSVTDNRSCTSG
jgi:hypothetical protein